MNSPVFLPLLMVFTILLNLPFGYMRARSRKFSIQWFLYIHLPIPVLIFLRLSLGFTWKAIPFIAVAAITGQFAGGRMGGK